MVYTLSQKGHPNASFGNQLGNSISQGFQQSFQPAVQQEYQRGRLQQALEQAKASANQPGAKPVDVLFSLLQAGAGIPGSERYIGQIAPLLLDQARNNQTPSVQDIKGGQNPNVSNMRGGQLQSGGASPQANQQVGRIPQVNNPNEGVFPEGKGIQLGNYLPYNLGDQISPEQTADILDKVKRSQGDVDFTRQQIRDYNAGKIGQTDLANANVDKQTAQVQRQLASERNVKNFLNEQLPAATPESKKNLYYNLMNKVLPEYKDLTGAYQKVTKQIADFDKLERKWIGSIPEGDFYGFTDSQEKTLRSTAKPLLETDPLAYNILEEAIVQKGNTIVDAAKTLKPETPKLKTLLSNADDYRELIYPKYNISDRAMLRNIDMAQEQQSKSSGKIADQLSKIWGDDVSLINIYTELSKKGWFPEQIREVFDQLSDKFNSQQQVEFTQLNKHPRIPARYLFQ
jgi:hypothetical protein